MNKVVKIKNDQGEWISSREAIGNALCKSFTEILKTQADKDPSRIKDLIKPTIIAENNLKLIEIPSMEEIKMRCFK